MLPRITEHNLDLGRRLLELIIIRALALMLGLNLADRLALLPERVGSMPFLASFNILGLILTFVFLAFWRFDGHRKAQLFFQIGSDLALTTALIAFTRGMESPFVSFYLLIIIYCSLTLGRNGGMVGAALSTILYAGLITADHLGVFALNHSRLESQQATFRIAAHALGFWAVAYLGTYLHRRLQAVEWELKEKIDSLTQLQRLNEHIVTSIRSGLITTDLQGRIAVFNNAAGELTGHDTKEMLGRPIQLLVGENFWGQILADDLFRYARPLRLEQWFAIPGGKMRYLGFSVSPLLDENHELLGYILSFQDLTEIKRLEEEVQLKDRMAVIGRMAAGIAHEIRNPLTAMQGSVEILRSHAKLPQKDERLLDILVRESDRLNKFVEDFLTFARPRKYDKHPIDLVPVLKDSVALLKNSPTMRDRHSVILEFEDREVWVRGSVDKLKQVFWNLSQNAVRAMPNGGELKIAARKTPAGVQVVFQDNGIGMSPEEQEQILQPFSSKFSTGLGLGLTIVLQIMEDHQARVTFESEKGKGTKAVLSFPPSGQELNIREVVLPDMSQPSDKHLMESERQCLPS
jgi:two-component system, NtrC family, sensor histidine kinase PilS